MRSTGEGWEVTAMDVVRARALDQLLVRDLLHGACLNVGL
jgi:hypothetical protein